MWKHDIEQPPPTPGLAQWAWNSLFNRQTPMSKYNAMKQEAQHQQKRPVTLDNDSDITDTFHYKKPSRRTATYRTQDDTDLLNRKNVSFNAHDYNDRALHRTRSRDSDFYREKELLPDLDPIDTPQRPPSAMRRSYSASTVDRLAQDHVSLPTQYPGKFPSPYVYNNDILSSGTKNLMTADENTERNKHIPLFSSSPVVPVPAADWRRRLAGSTKKKSEPVKKTQQQAAGPSLFQRTRRWYTDEEKAAEDYSPTLDQNEILRQLDQNAMELDQLTAHINSLKPDKPLASSYYDLELEEKYKSIRAELCDELRKSKKLYDSYYRFVGKYKELKVKYETVLKHSEPAQKVRALEKDILLLKDENQYLKDQIKQKEAKLQEDDFTLTDLKSTLQNSSKFEVTLRRKIRYLEEKLDAERQAHKQKEFDLNEKIYMLEMKAKEDEERLRQAEDKIKLLQGESRRSRPQSFSTYRATPSRSRSGRDRPLSMNALGHSHSDYVSPLRRQTAANSFSDDSEYLHEDTIDKLIKETL